MRIGEGHDTHRLVAGRKFILGGIEIPHPTGPIGHSDADVLLHCVTDALLGAIGQGDIGDLFPDTQEENRDVNSEIFLKAALERIQQENWQIVNLDCTVFAQLPKLSPYKESIRENLARVLQIERSQVNVKAKTGEKVGPIGREEAISASAVVLLAKTE
ncbi:MAG: 2-C-methyl-D-erythritol 2,4-cyclodiphosphate synthase [Planctomycetaceae bacterium]|nr:2-C-methyl-D-erythritol 2,4-cyclodiphosphate synthase [Planctomycetaceae bacterium]